MSIKRYPCVLLLAGWIAITLLCSVHAEPIAITPPTEGQWVVDSAQFLIPEDRAAIEGLSQTLLADREIPLIVVSIESMAHYGVEDLPIETFARYLFEQWGQDPEFAVRDTWKQGILFLVAKGDRVARIELGAAWSPEQSSACTRIMDQIVVPAFKAGNFSTGIREGVAALDQLGRGAPVMYPSITGSPTSTKSIVGLAILLAGGFALLYGGLILVARKLFPPLNVTPMTVDDFAQYQRDSTVHRSDTYSPDERSTDISSDPTPYDPFPRHNTSDGNDYGGGGGASGSW